MTRDRQVRRQHENVVPKLKILTFALAFLLTLSFTSLLVNPIPSAHALSCTNTYSSPPSAQWTIGAAGTYCLDAGIYDTQITITASGVTLTGSPGTTASQVIIQPDQSVITANANDPQQPWGSPDEAVIYANGGSSGISGVTVEGLTVDGSVASAAFSSCGPPGFGWFVGILFLATTGTITNNIVENILQAGPSLYGCQQDAASGIIVGMGYDTSSAAVTVSQNTITNFAKGGLICYEAGLTCYISGNTVASSASIGTEADTYGIQIGPYSTGSVTGNLVTDNVYSGASSPGCDLVNDNQGVGMYTVATGSVTVSGNVFVGNDVGLFMYQDTGTIATTDNAFSSSTCVGIAVYDESQTLTGNTFTGMPVGIEAVSDTNGLTATATYDCSSFSGVASPTATEAVNGGTANVVAGAAPCTVSSTSTTVSSTTTTTVTTTITTAPAPPPNTVVTCTPATVVVGTRITCTATVSSSTVGSQSPTGWVWWYTSGSGRFSRPACKLADGSCSVTYTPTATSGVTITAKYLAHHNNPCCVSTFYESVALASSATTLSCTSHSVVAGSPTIVRCTAGVTGYRPTGTVTFSETSTNGGSVTFASTTCTLARGHCSITLTGNTAGTVTIQASYSGDGNNAPSSSNTRGLTIKG